MSEKRLKTYMTQVFFKCPGQSEPEALMRPRSRSSPDQAGVFLFDDLLGGGIVVPNDIWEARLCKSGQSYDWATPGLLMLVTGAPGSGKTTFALELCYRLALNDNSEFHPDMKNGLSSVYVSAEASAPSVIQNAISYGWDDTVFHELPAEPQDITTKACRVFLFGRDKAKDRDKKKHETAEDALRAISGDWWVPSDGFSPERIRPRILVIDSLNSLGEKAPEELSFILRRCANSYLLTVAIMDTGPGISPEHHWAPSEYMADMEINFSYDRPENYMIRRMWVVKARFQDHADGWHRMKINPTPKDAVPNPLNPVIKEGGIFVFPSVHRHLSLARGELDKAKTGEKAGARHPKPIETPFRALTDAIQGGGFPKGACTAIVGDRGGMKSHLAYYTLLKFLANPENEDKRAVIISLRDTEDAAIDTLADILSQQVDDDGMHVVNKASLEKRDKAKAHVKSELIEKDRLEVLYFWPGYISPEEFFHLVCTSVDRPGIGKDGGKTSKAALVVINGLEQLSARFPLCAKENMFISGLLSVLTVKGITVIITSGGVVGLSSDRGGVPEGLLPMSDLIVQTSFRLLPAERVWSPGVWFPPSAMHRNPSLSSATYKNPSPEMVAERERTAKGEEPHVIYEIIREPGARECRQRVLFYMGRAEDSKGHSIPWVSRQTGFVPGSVYVRPLPETFPHGERP